MLGQKQVEDGTKMFHQKLLQIIDELAPEKSEKVPTKRVIGQPWMTRSLLKCAKKQLSLYKTALCTKSMVDQEWYKQYHNVLKRAKRVSRESLYVNRCYELRSNTKKLWNLINSVTGKVRDKSYVISKISIGTVDYTSPEKIADVLVKQFANMGKNYTEKIKSDIPIKEYLDKIGQNTKSVYLHPTNTTEILTKTVADGMIFETNY